MGTQNRHWRRPAIRAAGIQLDVWSSYKYISNGYKERSICEQGEHQNVVAVLQARFTYYDTCYRRSFSKEASSS